MPAECRYALNAVGESFVKNLSPRKLPRLRFTEWNRFQATPPSTYRVVDTRAVEKLLQPERVPQLPGNLFEVGFCADCWRNFQARFGLNRPGDALRQQGACLQIKI